MKRVLLLGSSGMIGGHIKDLILQSDRDELLTTFVRKHSNTSHDRLNEIVRQDYTVYEDASQDLENIDIAYFCIGVYTGSVPDEEFKKITVDYVISFADALYENSPEATFVLLSGAGADRTEKSRTAFAKYKGMAENYILGKGFKNVFIFRPAYIYPVIPRQEPNLMYRVSRFLYPMLKVFGNKFSITSTQLAEAMFNVIFEEPDETTLENQDILESLG